MLAGWMSRCRTLRLSCKNATHHDLHERVRDEVERGEARDIPRELDDLRERVERAGLDHDEDRAAVDSGVRAADHGQLPGLVPDAAGDEAGDEDVVGEGKGVLSRGEAGQVSDKNSVARTDSRKERRGRLRAEDG